MIYLDSAATTKISEEALSEVVKYSREAFFNPSAGYKQAVEVKIELANARERLKKVLGTKIGDIIFTSGATESNNLAIRGSERKGNYEYVFSSGEHPSVMEVAQQMKREGKIVHFIPLTHGGEIKFDFLEKCLNERTRLVSVMLVNNVTGAINNIKLLSKLVRKLAPNALIHVDGVQAFTKLDFKLDDLDVDFFSISAHKFHGPKGVGALWVRNKSSLKSMIFGGGQEQNLRSGTENVPAIMGMVKAAECENIKENLSKVERLKAAFLKEFSDFPQVKLVGENLSPYIQMMLFKSVNSETLVRMLECEVVVGRGSACSAKKAGNSVLEAMGYPLSEIKGAVRVSFDALLTIRDVMQAAKIIKEKYLELLERTK